MEVGHQLITARQRRGLTLDDISRTTKIPVSLLEAIERDDVARLPQGFFTRAFVRAYAHEVGVNPDDLLDHERLSEVAVEEFADAPTVHVPIEEASSSKSLFAGLAIGAVCTMFYSSYAAPAPAPAPPTVAVASLSERIEPAALAPPPCAPAAPVETPVQVARRPEPVQPTPVTHVIPADPVGTDTVVDSLPVMSDAILPTPDPAPAAAPVQQF